MKKLFLINSGWRLIGEFFYFFTQFIVSAILARILSKEDFGIVASVLILTTFLCLLNDAGLKNLVVQRLDDNLLEFRKISGSSIIIGTIISALMIALSPLLAILMKTEKLILPCIVTSVCFIFDSFSAVQSGILEKRFLHKNVAIYRTLSSIVSSIVGILLAINGIGYWSIICMIILRSAIFAVLIVASTKVFVPIISISYTKSLLAFTSTMISHNLFVYVFSDIDKIVMGRFYQLETLGLYNRSYTLFSVYMRLITSPIHVLYSVFYKCRDDAKMIIDIYYKYLYIIAITTVPLMTSIAIWSKEITLFIWGKGWDDASIYLSIICFASFPVIITSFSRILAISFRREKLLVAFSGIYAFLATLLCFLGTIFGSPETIIGYVISNWLAAIVLSVYIEFFLLKGIRFTTLRIFVKVFAISTSTAVLSIALKHTTDCFDINYILSLTLSHIAILLFMGCYIFVFDKSLIKEAIKLINHKK